MAVFGFALSLTPTQVWEALPKSSRLNLQQWLIEINDHDMPKNNWGFFRVRLNPLTVNPRLF